ncbi:MAG: hypothetical protein R2825_27450 [Saprospiraceae bacterium]
MIASKNTATSSRAQGEYGFRTYPSRNSSLPNITSSNTPAAVGMMPYWEEMRNLASNAAWLETMVLYFEGFNAIPERTAEDCIDAFKEIAGWEENRQYPKTGTLPPW